MEQKLKQAKVTITSKEEPLPFTPRYSASNFRQATESDQLHKTSYAEKTKNKTRLNNPKTDQELKQHLIALVQAINQLLK